MIDPRAIREWATRYHTTTDNVVREYFQHLFLSHLYRQPDAGHLLFKGGTALRIIWQSPRFSEDLDFTGASLTIRKVESLLEKTMSGVQAEGLRVNMEEAKKTSGGYLAIFLCEGGGHRHGLQVEISFRSAAVVHGTAALIASDGLPPFTLMHLDEKALVGEKIAALLSRAKPRDFYDLYFILRRRLAFHAVFQHDRTLKGRLVDAVAQARLDTQGELKRFLPVNQHALLKNFSSLLLSELEKTFP